MILGSGLLFLGPPVYLYSSKHDSKAKNKKQNSKHAADFKRQESKKMLTYITKEHAGYEI